MNIFHVSRYSHRLFEKNINVRGTVSRASRGEFFKHPRIICFSDFGMIAICEDAKLKNEPLESGNRADCYKIEYFAPILHTGAWRHDSSRANVSKDSVFQLRPRSGVIRGEWRANASAGQDDCALNRKSESTYRETTLELQITEDGRESFLGIGSHRRNRDERERKIIA